MVVIDSHGSYVPLYRVKRSDITTQHGKGESSGETAVPERDENLITMASEAAQSALEGGSINKNDISAVFVASTTDRFAEHGIAPHVAYRHGIEGDVRTGDFRGSARAAGDAFASGVNFVESTSESALIVGVDIIPVEPGHDDEPYSGAGSGAVILSESSSNPEATVEAIGQNTTGFVERHRRHGETAEEGDKRFEGEKGFGEGVQKAVENALEGVTSFPSRVALQVHDKRMARSALEDFPGINHDSTFDDVGYAGTATFFLDLCLSLEEADPETTTLAVSYGAGGADAFLLEVHEVDNEAMSVRDYIESKEYVTYARYLKNREPVEYKGVVLE